MTTQLRTNKKISIDFINDIFVPGIGSLLLAAMSYWLVNKYGPSVSDLANLLLSIFEIQFIMHFSYLIRSKNQTAETSRRIENIDSSNLEMKRTFDKYVEMSIKLNIDSIDQVLRHLCNEYAKNCVEKECEKCASRYSECNPLLRRFLDSDMQALIDSIKKGREECVYILDTNIKPYHTIAIEQLLTMKVKYYGVVHSIGTGMPAEPQFTEYDIHFLRELMYRVYEEDYQAGKKYADVVNFEIRWILVGSWQNMLNTYDYVIKQILDVSPECQELAKSKFHLAVLPEIEYRHRLDAGNKKLTQYFNPTAPNIGIFGDQYAFFEDPTGAGHGRFFWPNSRQPTEYAGVTNFFQVLWKDSNILNWDTIIAHYKKLQS